MDVDSPYNAFLGRLAFAEFRACIAPWCLLLKFPMEEGVGVVRGNRVAGWACYQDKWKKVRVKEKGEATDNSSPSKDIIT